MFGLPTSANMFLKTDLEPFTPHEFRVIAMNAYGETESEWAQLTTQQDSE